MLLADSNIFIDLWRNPSQEMVDTFLLHEIVICGVVKAELLCGAVSEKNYREIERALAPIGSLSIEEADWTHVGELLYKLRKAGVNLPFTDVVIAYIGMTYDVPIWTKDHHFSLIAQVEPSLKLY